MKLPYHACRLIPRTYRLIVAIAVIFTGVGAYLTSKLSLESDLAELLPSTFASVQALDEMREKVGGAVSKLRVVIESQDFSALVRLAEALEPRLEESEHVRYVAYQNEVGFFKENALLFLDTLRLDSLYDAVQGAIDDEKQSLNPFMIDDLFGGGEDEESGRGLDEWEAEYRSKEPKPYYTNADSTVLVIEVFPAAETLNVTRSRAMLAAVREIVESLEPTSYASDVQVFYAGNIKNRIDEYDTLTSDIFGTAVYGVTGVFLLLLLYFRSLVPPILIASALGASLTWTFGVTYLVIGQLNTITGFLFVVLFGLGIDYGIHAFARYRESRQAGLDRAAGLHNMVCETGVALATTTFTTAAAFFSLLLMDFKGFSELGFITGVGLIFALVAMMFLLPALIIGAETLGLLRIPRVPGKTLTFEPRPFRPARKILVVGGVVTVVALAGAAKMRFEYDFTELRIVTTERRAASERMRGVFSRSESPALILAASREEAEAVREQVEALRQGNPDGTTVDQVTSVYSLVPEDQGPRLERIRWIRELIEEEDAEELLKGEDLDRLQRLQGYLAVDRPITFDDIPATEIRPFLDREGEIGSFVFIYPSVRLRDGRNAIRFAEEIGAITLPSGKVLHAASPNIIIADLLRMAIREGKQAVALSLAVVFLILLADVRSLKGTLLVMSPLILGLTWMGGLMFILGMKFNLFNMVVLPSVVGIGVDAGVHIHHRYREEGPGSLHLVLRRTGPAVAVATITTIVGYTGLMLASHPGLVSIGKLAVVGLSATLVSAVFMLPALIQVFEKQLVVAGGSPLGEDVAISQSEDALPAPAAKSRSSLGSGSGAPGVERDR